MRLWCVLAAGLAVLVPCARSQTTSANLARINPAAASVGRGQQFVGFDRNEYPGDATMAAMHATFAFTGYWITVPPGAMFNQWKGKREILKQQGWGFLVLANGKLEKEILKAQKTGAAPENLGRKDAAAAIASAKAEGFPQHTILFLDQEEGGRLTGPQAAYLLAWTEAVAASGFRPAFTPAAPASRTTPGSSSTPSRTSATASAKAICIRSLSSTRRTSARPRPAARSHRSRSRPPACRSLLRGSIRSLPGAPKLRRAAPPPTPQTAIA